MEVPANASPVLSDPFGRTVDYLRVSVTDRCDLRCSYCMPRRFRGFEQPEHWLTLDEITRVVAAFSRMGTRRVRLTGGEPLLRKGLPMLAAGIAALPGIDDLSLTTNGTQLGRQAMLLRSAGVQRLNVSLDSLRHDCVQHITVMIWTPDSVAASIGPRATSTVEVSHFPDVLPASFASLR